MVSKKKIQTVQEVKELVKKYPAVGILDMFKLPAKQLHEIREKLRGKAVIIMVKKRLIKLILEQEKVELLGYVKGEPALLFTEVDPFELAKIIQESKSLAPAKPGDIAPIDIVVRAGQTSLSPGPVIGELQRVKIHAAVEGEKIVVKSDTTVAKEGDEISKEQADILSKLGIEPMEIGLNLVAIWSGGIVYKKDILFIPVEEYLEKIKHAHSNAFNLSLNINYLTSSNISLLLSKAYQEALSLANAGNILTSESVKQHLAKAHTIASSLKDKVKTDIRKEEPTKEEKVEEKKKEKPKEAEKKSFKDKKQEKEKKKDKG